MKIYALVASILLSLPMYAHAEKLERHYLNPWEKPNGFAGATRVGNLVFLAGVTGKGEDFPKALLGAYQDLEKHLKLLNLSFKDVAKETIYTTDMEQLKKHIALRNQFFNNHYPAATWVQIDRLYTPEIKVEVDIIAVITDDKEK